VSNTGNFAPVIKQHHVIFIYIIVRPHRHTDTQSERERDREREKERILEQKCTSQTSCITNPSTSKKQCILLWLWTHSPSTAESLMMPMPMQIRRILSGSVQGSRAKSKFEKAEYNSTEGQHFVYNNMGIMYNMD
jgi:hypothetical protein